MASTTPYIHLDAKDVPIVEGRIATGSIVVRVAGYGAPALIAHPDALRALRDAIDAFLVKDMMGEAA
jgi:hypothetical protein